MSPERSRFYGQLDTSVWPNRQLMQRAVTAPETLSAADQRRWENMCAALGIPHDVGL